MLYFRATLRRCRAHLASRPCLIACLPDERHITGPSGDIPVVDTDRVCASYLNVNHVVGVNGHDSGSCCATVSLGDGRAGRRVQADPCDCGAGTGSMYQAHLTYSSINGRGAASHD